MPAFFPTEWTRPRQRPVLEPRQVHVWSAPLDVPAAALARLRTFLTNAEIQRAERLRRPLHRARYVAARGYLRTLLGVYLHTDPAALRFRLGKFGKPFLAQERSADRLEFNSTDSQSMGLFGFIWGRELGVDLECLPRNTDYVRIARRKFAAIEAEHLAKIPATEQLTAFLACWTRKEAYGKALGVGIRYPLHEVVLCDALQCATRPLIDSEQSTWVLKQIQPTPNSVAAIVVAGADDWTLRCFELDPATVSDYSAFTF